MKTCRRCKQAKSLSEYHKHRAQPDGYRAICKECRTSESLQYSLKNRAKINENAKNRRRKFPLYHQDYYAANKRYFEDYRERNKPKYKRWRQENKKKLNEYRAEKIRNEPEFKLACSLRSKLSAQMKKYSAVKSQKTMVLLGCSLPEFRMYLELRFQKGMTWSNYGEWHIDHIKPCSSFDLSKAEDQAVCFHYSNLQPLWAIDNLKKGNRASQVAFDVTQYNPSA